MSQNHLPKNILTYLYLAAPLSKQSHYYIIIVILSYLSPNLQAKTWSLSSCQQRALHKHPTLQAARLRLHTTNLQKNLQLQELSLKIDPLALSSNLHKPFTTTASSNIKIGLAYGGELTFTPALRAIYSPNSTPENPDLYYNTDEMAKKHALHNYQTHFNGQLTWQQPIWGNHTVRSARQQQQIHNAWVQAQLQYKTTVVKTLAAVATNYRALLSMQIQQIQLQAQVQRAQQEQLQLKQAIQAGQKAAFENDEKILSIIELKQKQLELNTRYQAKLQQFRQQLALSESDHFNDHTNKLPIPKINPLSKSELLQAVTHHPEIIQQHLQLTHAVQEHQYSKQQSQPEVKFSLSASTPKQLQARLQMILAVDTPKQRLRQQQSKVQVAINKELMQNNCHKVIESIHSKQQSLQQQQQSSQLLQQRYNLEKKQLAAANIRYQHGLISLFELTQRKQKLNQINDTIQAKALELQNDYEQYQILINTYQNHALHNLKTSWPRIRLTNPSSSICTELINAVICTD